MQALQAIQTTYNGYRFRSRLEARYAVMLDDLRLPWTYEKEGFDLGDDGKYLPDFWLPDIDAFMEVKPRVDWMPTGIYLAGTCETQWRRGLNLCGHIETSYKPELRHDDSTLVVFDAAIDGIARCEWMFAWIDRETCRGTLAEVGMAYSLDKKIGIAFPDGFRDSLPRSKVYNDNCTPAHDFWFAEQCASFKGEFSNPQSALNAMFDGGWIERMPKELRKVVGLSRASGKDVWIVCDPELKDVTLRDVTRVNAIHVTPYGGFRCVPFFGMFDKWIRPHHSAATPWLENAFRAFRSARFEHGESGAGS